MNPNRNFFRPVSFSTCLAAALALLATVASCDADHAAQSDAD